MNTSRLLMPEKDLRRFYSFCVVDLETGCWNWKDDASHTHFGYGAFWLPWSITNPKPATNKSVSGRVYPAHLVAYNHFVDAVPEGLELGHIRQGDKCAFWEHVRPITRPQNMQERFGTPIGVCKHGHDVERWRKPGSRGCQVCKRIRESKRTNESRGQYPFAVCASCGYSICRCEEVMPGEAF